MHFNCPVCHQRLEVEDERVGENISCPACEHAIRVPKAPMLLKGLRSHGSIRLVPIPPAERHLRHGSLAERMAAAKSEHSAVVRSATSLLLGGGESMLL